MIEIARLPETQDLIQEFVEEAHWSDDSEVTLEAEPPLND